jgi:hypothetical protein
VDPQRHDQQAAELDLVRLSDQPGLRWELWALQRRRCEHADLHEQAERRADGRCLPAPGGGQSGLDNEGRWDCHGSQKREVCKYTSNHPLLVIAAYILTDCCDIVVAAGDLLPRRCGRWL